MAIKADVCGDLARQSRQTSECQSRQMSAATGRVNQVHCLQPVGSSPESEDCCEFGVIVLCSLSPENGDTPQTCRMCADAVLPLCIPRMARKSQTYNGTRTKQFTILALRWVVTRILLIPYDTRIVIDTRYLIFVLQV